jgi:hypothetical protein
VNPFFDLSAKRRTVLIFVVFWVVFRSAALLCAGGRSESDSNAAARVRVLEHRRAEAEVRKDNIALDAMFDNALVMIEDDGTLRSKAEYLSRLHLAGTALLEIAVESMTLRSFGPNTVIVDGTYRDKRVQDGKVFVRHRRSIDTWVFKARQWICVAAAARALP